MRGQRLHPGFVNFGVPFRKERCSPVDGRRLSSRRSLAARYAISLLLALLGAATPLPHIGEQGGKDSNQSCSLLHWRRSLPAWASGAHGASGGEEPGILVGEIGRAHV